MECPVTCFLLLVLMFPGYLIEVEPKQKVYVPIKNISQIDSVCFSIKDQDNNFVDMNNERVTYYVHLRESI